MLQTFGNKILVLRVPEELFTRVALVDGVLRKGRGLDKNTIDFGERNCAGNHNGVVVTTGRSLSSRYDASKEILHVRVFDILEFVRKKAELDLGVAVGGRWSQGATPQGYNHTRGTLMSSEGATW